MTQTTNDRIRRYVWSEDLPDPLDLIGKTARIRVTLDGGAGAPYRGQPTTKVTEMVYTGVIRDIHEDHGSAVVDREDTLVEAADGAAFEDWQNTTFYTDQQKIVFNDKAHVVIDVLTRS